MRIAVVNLTGGGLSGGYKKYLQNILPLMANDKQIDGIEVYVPMGYEYLVSGSKLSMRSIPANNLSKSKAWLRDELNKQKVDVVYIPSGIWVDCGETPVVTMIQNMEPLVVPFQGNPLKERIKNVARYMANYYACRRANRIIAISEFVKTYLIEKWRIPEDRIGLVYHGIDLPSNVNVDANEKMASLKSNPFIFAAGSIRPARGLEDVIQALGLLKKHSINLVIAGGVDPGMEPYYNKLKKMAASLGINEQIHWVGRLNDGEMAWCYFNCEAFVMTSRVEACPNIALEAMAHGCLSVSTESPPMPEFFQDVAIYYPPKNYQALANAIRDVLFWDENKRKEMSDKAKNRASQFSWEICAKKTVDQLQLAIENYNQMRR